MQTLANLDWQKKKRQKTLFSPYILYSSFFSTQYFYDLSATSFPYLSRVQLPFKNSIFATIRRKYILFKLYQAHSLQKSKKRSLGYFVVAVGDVRISQGRFQLPLKKLPSFLNQNSLRLLVFQNFHLTFHLQSVFQSVGVFLTTSVHTYTHTSSRHISRLVRVHFSGPKPAIQIPQVEIGFINMSMSAISYLNPPG